MYLYRQYFKAKVYILFGYMERYPLQPLSEP